MIGSRLATFGSSLDLYLFIKQAHSLCVSFPVLLHKYKFAPSMQIYYKLTN